MNASSVTEESRSASDADRPALTDPERAQLVYAIRRCARQKGLSSSVTDRYQAWIFVFVAWCHEHPPHRVDRGRIGAFREALHERADVEQEEVHEAMDALAFLFGAAEEVMPLLASRDPVPEGASKSEIPSGLNSAAGAKPGEDGIQTLEVGWQSGTEAPGGTIRTPQIPMGHPSDATSAGVPDAEPEEEEPEGAPSTAELCIERFQTQVESLHAPDPDASDPSV